MADPENKEFPRGVLTPSQINDYATVFFHALNTSNQCFQSQANAIIQEALITVSAVQNVALEHLEKALEEKVNVKQDTTLFNEPIPAHVTKKLENMKEHHEKELQAVGHTISGIQSSINRQESHQVESAENSRVLEAFSEAVANSVLISMENALNAQNRAFTTLLASTTQALEMIYSITSASISTKVERALENKNSGKGNKSSNGVVKSENGKLKKEILPTH